MLSLLFLLVYVSAATQLQVLPLADRQSHFRVDLQADDDNIFFQDAVLCVGMQAPTEHTTCSSANMFRCTLETQAHGTRKTLVVGPLEDASEHAYYLLDTRLNTGEQCVKQLTINHPLPEEKADKALVETSSVAENALSKDQEPWYYYSLVMMAAVAIVALLVAGVIVVWYNGHKNGPSLWSKGFMDAYAERRKQNRQLASESLNLLRPLEEI